MKQAVFIASLSHSGSTLLSLILGCHSRIVGLGEIARVLKQGPLGLEKTRQGLCSCNQNMDHCEFWGQVSPELDSLQDAPADKKYGVVFETFAAKYGDDFIPVDSSKYLPALKSMRRQFAGELKVIFLIKDVRAYTVSQLERASRKKLSLRYRTAAYHFIHWYRSNRAVNDYLVNENISHIRVGYEELCLYPRQTVETICEFLGQPYEPSMLALKDSGSHVIRGNRLRNQPGKQEIAYDHRWFYRKEWIIWTLLFPWIMKFNDDAQKTGTVRQWAQ